MFSYLELLRGNYYPLAMLKNIEVLENVIDNLEKLGGFLKNELNKQLSQQGLSDEIVFEGNNWWPRLNIKNKNR